MRSQHVKIPGGWPELYRLRVRGRFKAGESHTSTVFWDDNAGCGAAAALVRGVESGRGRWRWPQQPEGSSLGLRRALQREGVWGEQADQGVVTEAGMTALAGCLGLSVTETKEG